MLFWASAQPTVALVDRVLIDRVNGEISQSIKLSQYCGGIWSGGNAKPLQKPPFLWVW